MNPEHSYTTVDKTDWGAGAWHSEPDKLQWIDESTDLDCLIVRGPSGALCGYVGVPPGHPYHGVSYGEDSPEAQIMVHGGLTFSERCDEHADPAKGICHVPWPGRPADVWWFGFDCAHSGDLMPGSDARLREFGHADLLVDGIYCDLDYVRAEVTRLAAQLMSLA